MPIRPEKHHTVHLVTWCLLPTLIWNPPVISDKLLFYSLWTSPQTDYLYAANSSIRDFQWIAKSETPNHFPFWIQQPNTTSFALLTKRYQRLCLREHLALASSHKWIGRLRFPGCKSPSTRSPCISTLVSRRSSFFRTGKCSSLPWVRRSPALCLWRRFWGSRGWWRFWSWERAWICCLIGKADGSCASLRWRSCSAGTRILDLISRGASEEGRRERGSDQVWTGNRERKVSLQDCG